MVNRIKGLVTASKEVKDSFKDTFSDSLKQYFDELKNFGGQVGAAVVGAFKGLEDQLTTFVTTGKANFRDLANSIISDIARIAIKLRFKELDDWTSFTYRDDIYDVHFYTMKSLILAQDER